MNRYKIFYEYGGKKLCKTICADSKIEAQIKFMETYFIIHEIRLIGRDIKKDSEFDTLKDIFGELGLNL